MSTIRKVSLAFRIARQEAREKRATEIQAADLEAYQRMLKLGLIKPPKFVERTARMELPRQDLIARLLAKRKWVRGMSEDEVRATLRRRGHRVGIGKPIEIARLPGKKAPTHVAA